MKKYISGGYNMEI